MLETRAETMARLDEFIGRRRGPFWFNVAPRFTPGSPAMVKSGQALRVADLEREAYRYATDERMGTAEVEKADRLGLRGIVEVVRETRQGWDTLDLLTGERRLVPFAERR